MPGTKNYTITTSAENPNEHVITHKPTGTFCKYTGDYQDNFISESDGNLWLPLSKSNNRVYSVKDGQVYLHAAHLYDDGIPTKTSLYTPDGTVLEVTYEENGTVKSATLKKGTVVINVF